MQASKLTFDPQSRSLLKTLTNILFLIIIVFSLTLCRDITLTKNWCLRTFWHFSNFNYFSDSYLHCPFHFRIKCTFSIVLLLSWFRYHISIRLNSCSELKWFLICFLSWLEGKYMQSKSTAVKGMQLIQLPLVHPLAWSIYTDGTTMW